MRSSVAREQEPSNKRSDDLPIELSIAVRRKNSGRMQFGVLQQNRPKQVWTVRFKEARETGYFDSPQSELPELVRELDQALQRT
jgi:hypothetical protein